MREDFERIRTNIKAFGKKNGIKLSMVTDHYNSITVSMMVAPEEVLVCREDGYAQINHYYIETSPFLTDYGKTICKGINEIIEVEHWDKSDIMTDYFHCAFYYNIHVGKWNKPFSIKEGL